MGAEETVKVDINIIPYNGEKILVCSDGLTNFTTDEEIRDIMNEPHTLQENSEKLIELANSRGGKDNITIVALEKENRDEQ